jgi:hypothetical protein
MNLTTLDIDLAKTSFSLVEMDHSGKILLRKIATPCRLVPFNRNSGIMKGRHKSNADAPYSHHAVHGNTERNPMQFCNAEAL